MQCILGHRRYRSSSDCFEIRFSVDYGITIWRYLFRRSSFLIPNPKTSVSLSLEEGALTRCHFIQMLVFGQFH